MQNTCLHKYSTALSQYLVEAPLAAVIATSLHVCVSVSSGHCNVSSFFFAELLKLCQVTWGVMSEQPFSSPDTNSRLDGDLDWDDDSGIPDFSCRISIYSAAFILPSTLTRFPGACCMTTAWCCHRHASHWGCYIYDDVKCFFQLTLGSSGKL